MNGVDNPDEDDVQKFTRDTIGTKKDVNVHYFVQMKGALHWEK